MLTFQQTIDIILVILVMRITKFISLELDMERIGLEANRENRITTDIPCCAKLFIFHDIHKLKNTKKYLYCIEDYSTGKGITLIETKDKNKLKIYIDLFNFKIGYFHIQTHDYRSFISKFATCDLLKESEI